MILAKRVSLEPAFVLHTRPFKETSLLIDIFTKSLGRINLVAKGAKKPKSSLRTVLTPCSMFSISFSGRGELKNLNTCEIVEHYPLKSPLTLTAIVYVNELLMKSTERDDPHDKIFKQYQLVCEGLSKDVDQARTEVLLREFELVLLQELGYGIDLRFDSMTGKKIKSEQTYSFEPNLGFVQQADNLEKNNDYVFSGQDIINLSEGDLTEHKTRKASKTIMRLALDFHLGNRSLNIRKYLSSN